MGREGGEKRDGELIFLLLSVLLLVGGFTYSHYGPGNTKRGSSESDIVLSAFIA